MDFDNRVQTRVPEFHKWTLEKLVGLEGRNEGDVLSRIIGYWIRENEDWLEKRGITFEAFEAEQRIRNRLQQSDNDGELAEVTQI